MATSNSHDPLSMIHPHDDFRHCPHCGRRTRHSIVRERVLAPVLWCMGCFRTRTGDDESHAAAAPAVRPALRLAG